MVQSVVWEKLLGFKEKAPQLGCSEAHGHPKMETFSGTHIGTKPLSHSQGVKDQVSGGMLSQPYQHLQCLKFH